MFGEVRPVIPSYSNELPPTRSQGWRWYHLTGGGEQWAYRVTIGVAAKRGSREQVDVYAVDFFDDPDLPPGFRRIWFKRETGTPTPDRPELYQVTIGEDGRPLQCTCKGSTCGLQQPDCKHKAVAADMLAMGALDNPQELPTLY